MKTKNKYRIPLLVLSLFLLAGISKGDGLIVIPRANNPYPLEVVYHKVNVEITDQYAKTNIDQEFYNPSNSQLEGYYIFPLPAGAVIKDFKMEIGGKMVEAELLDADKAKKIYEDIVRKMRDPALLEYGERGLFKVRIFPIEPMSKKRVKISYEEVLSADNNITEYVYPLNTEKFSAKPLKEVSVQVQIRTSNELKSVYSPSHNIDVIRKSPFETKISYEEEKVKPAKDFKLYLTSSKNDLDISLLTYKDNSGEGYFMLSITPGVNYDKNDIAGKDITFILDNSGSMEGEKLKQAKAALTYCISNLNKNDRFEIIKFSTEASPLFNELVAADKENIKKAKEFIDKIKAVGGTNIEEAFQLGLKNKGTFNNSALVIFITDGKPTIGETDDNKLTRYITGLNKMKSRIFTFGIGNEINTYLLDKITDESRAYRTYVSPNEEIKTKISAFYNKVRYPALTNLRLKTGKNIELSKMHPKNLPDLFQGSSILLFGRYEGSGISKITLSGELNGKEQTYTADAYFDRSKESYDFIPTIWASRRVGYLLDQIRLNGESEEVKNEVVDLARKYGIITPYTSYLILEDETSRVAGGSLPRDLQTIGNVFDEEAARPDYYRAEFDAIKEKSGKVSIRSSEELQDLNKAENLPQTAQGGSRMAFKPNQQNNSPSAAQIQNVGNKTFYQSGEYWIDSDLQKMKPGSVIKVQFASDEYFKLFNSKGFEKYLALGKNVKFILNKQQYEIFD